jgi:putative peptidoglycan lipid II flippase
MARERGNLSRKQSVLALSISTMWSKLFGFLREMLTAYYFGAGVVKDAFNVSQAIPGRIGGAFFGAINNSLIPYLIHLKSDEGDEAFWKAYSSIYRWLITVLFVFVALMMILPQPFIAVLAPGFYKDPQRLSLTMFFIRFTALVFLFQVLSSMQISLLQIFENFIPQIGINIFASAAGVLVLAAAGLLHGATPSALALSALATGIVTFAVAYYTAIPYRANMTRERLWNKYVSDYLRFLLPVLINQIVIISYALVDQLMASFLPVGNISALNYASLLYNLPITLFVTPITSVLYPSISNFSASQDWNGQADVVSRGTQLIWLIVVPCTVGLAVLSLPIVKLIYMRGAFDITAAKLTSGALLYYSLGIPFLSLQTLLTMAFLAEKDTITPLIRDIIGVLLNATLNYIFGIRLRMYAAGFALGTAISWTVLCLWLYNSWTRRHRIRIFAIAGKIWKSTLGSLIMFLFIIAWQHYIPYERLHLIILIICSAVVYFASLLVLRDENMRDLTRQAISKVSSYIKH